MKLAEWENIMPDTTKVVPLTVGDNTDNWKTNIWDLSCILAERPELEDREISKITFAPYRGDVFLIWLESVETAPFGMFREVLDQLDYLTDIIGP